MRSRSCLDCLADPVGPCRRHRDPQWIEFAPDVPRPPRAAFRPLPEPIPARNVLAVCFDLALIACLALVVALAYLGKLDWLMNLPEMLRR